MTELIDVSNNNGHTDWPAVAAAGIDGAWCKVSEGASYVDPFWNGDHQHNRDEAHTAGLWVGGYHFATPGDPATQATRFARLLGPCTLPPVLDLEHNGFNADTAADFALTFLAELERLTGAHPMLYTFSGYPLRNDPRLTQWPLWLANYPGANTGELPAKAAPAKAPWRAWSCWQYTSGGHVPGVGGRCDRSTPNADWWASITDPHPAPIPTPSPTPHPEEDDMAVQFMRGKSTPDVHLVSADTLRHRHVANVKATAYELAHAGVQVIDPPAGAEVDVIDGAKVWVLADADMAEIVA